MFQDLTERKLVSWRETPPTRARNLMRRYGRGETKKTNYRYDLQEERAIVSRVWD
jgi:hypothetical protein